MSTGADYAPVWPETVVFWGAGATAALGMPTTSQQAWCLTHLSAPDRALPERVDAAFEGRSRDDQRDVTDLLIILDDSENNTERLQEALRRQFPCQTETVRRDRKDELQRRHNWRALRRLVILCPRDPESQPDSGGMQPIRLIDLFNLLDLHIQAGNGLYAPLLDRTGRDDSFIPPDDLIAARRTLQLLITMQFAVAYRRLLREPNGRLRPYTEFTRKLAQLMREEGQMLAGRGWLPTERDYTLFGYSVISLNWDPLLLWLLFNAHREANDDWASDSVGEPPQPQKLFNDVGYMAAVRKVEGTDLAVWYMMNESAVQRLNDPNHPGDRYIRFGKFYFPHSSFNFRECPNCGKLNVYLGNEWNVQSASLFAPMPLPRWSKGVDGARTKREESDRQEGRADTLQCVYCGSATRSEHVHLVMQSSFGTPLPPYLEDIHREMRAALENARHVVFLGYSLPQDDVIYRSVLAARLNRRRDDGDGDGPTISLVVGQDDGAPDRWLRDDEIDRELPQGGDLRRIYRELRSVVGHGRGEPRIRAYARGIPAAFGIGRGGCVSEATVRDLLFPDDLWSNRPRLRRGTSG